MNSSSKLYTIKYSIHKCNLMIRTVRMYVELQQIFDEKIESNDITKTYMHSKYIYIFVVIENNNMWLIILKLISG